MPDMTRCLLPTHLAWPACRRPRRSCPWVRPAARQAGEVALVPSEMGTRVRALDVTAELSNSMTNKRWLLPCLALLRVFTLRLQFTNNIVINLVS